jgi:lipid II:glycine glycyltransferase (peptidoglycan interpeptide bridge formation enzyme)
MLNGKIVAAAALLGYGKKVAWWKGGSSAEGYKTSAGNLLQLSAIDWAKRCGFEIYDLGGTDPARPNYAGIHEFKSSLGGTLVTSSVGSRSTSTARLASRVARSLR